MKYLIIITALLTIGFTTLVSMPGSPYLIGGYTQADISNMYPSLITPAGFTFSIWSVIYISWIILGLLVTLGKIKVTNQESILLSMSMFLTALWLVPWGYNMIGISLVIMLILLAILKYTFHITRDSDNTLRYSVDLTLGWIHIATIANITIYLLSVGFTGGGFPEVYWAIGVLGLAVFLTLYYQIRYKTYIISLVFLWTMLGEWVAHPIPLERYAVMAYAIIIAASMLFSYTKQ